MSNLAVGVHVELHSLSRLDLNGSRGVCYEFIAASGRWAVILNESCPRGGGLLVKPTNLRKIPDRADAARELGAFLAARHPERGFLLHPSVLAMGFELVAGNSHTLCAVAATAPRLLSAPRLRISSL